MTEYGVHVMCMYVVDMVMHGVCRCVLGVCG